ncbi:hypothetical protein ACF1E9_03315 [Streptomyces roseolus]|uniref:hypothetical protein n=1 Tax=Streptomyces roseolus TaxID=67358 RepID=UPI0036FE374A
MTEISKGEGPPDPGRARRIEGVGKSPGPGPDRHTAPGPGTGSAADGTPSTGAGSSVGVGSSAGSGPAGEGTARPPHRIDPADGGWWADPIAPSTAPTAEAAAAVAGLGGTFEDLVYAGRGGARFAMAETVPHGYVLVEFARTGRGHFDLDSIDWDGRPAVDLGDSDTSRRFERRVMWCDNLYPLRFRVDCDDRAEWVIVIRPVAGVRPLGEAATGRGTEVLLHTGAAGELVSRLSPSKPHASLRVRGHGPRRPGAPAPSPAPLGTTYGPPLRATGRLPEGPLLVEVREADGDWSLEVREPRPREERRPGFWGRLFGRRGY